MSEDSTVTASSSPTPLPSPSPSASPSTACMPRRPGLWRSSMLGPHWISKQPPLCLERPVELNRADQEDEDADSLQPSSSSSSSSAASAPLLHFEYLSARPDLLPAVSQALWDEWGAENFAPFDQMPSVAEVQQWLAEECCETMRLGCTIVASVGGSFVGCAMLAPEDSPTDHPYWGTVPWASYNVIVPAHRGRGYSTHVWTRITQLARQWGYKHVWAVAEGSLVGMYQKQGYKVIEAEVDFWGEPATVMRRDFK